MIDSIAYDMIDNVGATQMVDFLRMMDDYKSQLYMEELNREIGDSEGLTDDLPF